MPGSSAGNVGSSTNATKAATIPSPVGTPVAAATTSTIDKYDSSYNLNRFLSDQNYPLGYRQALSPEEAKQRSLSQLHDFDTKFARSENVNRR
ncbi:hypothetical protein GGI42DRAFT_362540 [Trichoderma sp. SZMC 28013]